MAKDLPALPVVRRKDGWWITGIPSEDMDAYGPYKTRSEADEDRTGLLRTFRRHPATLNPAYGREWRPDNLVPTNSVCRAWVPREWMQKPQAELLTLGITGFRRRPGEKVKIVIRPKVKVRRPGEKVKIVVARKRLIDKSMF